MRSSTVSSDGRSSRQSLLAAVLIALALPALSLNTATTGIDDISIPEIEPLKKLDAAFPGGNEPATVAIRADDVRSEPVQAAILELRRQALASGQMHTPIELEVSRDGTVVTVDVPLAGNGTDASSQAALATLRDELLPGRSARWTASSTPSPGRRRGTRTGKRR